MFTYFQNERRNTLIGLCLGEACVALLVYTYAVLIIAAWF